MTNSFSLDVSKWCKQTAPEYLEKVTRTVVFEIGNRIVQRSPVGDASYWKSPPPPGYVGGRFRGNWQYGFNSRPASYNDNIDPSGSQTLSSIASGLFSSPASGVHWISNNLPYAQRLEEGWSRQAPQGMVSLVEIEFESIVRAAK